MTALSADPRGKLLNYTQSTGSVSIVSTTEATGTTILSPGAITFDGTAVLVELQVTARLPTGAVGNFLRLSLFEGATQITRLISLTTLQTAAVDDRVAYAHFVFTPTAASHTYTITGMVTSTTGTPLAFGGAGGTGGNPPMFVRFTKN